MHSVITAIRNQDTATNFTANMHNWKTMKTEIQYGSFCERWCTILLMNALVVNCCLIYWFI